MKLLTKEIEEKLLANGRASAEAVAKDGDTPDHEPILKLFQPWGAATWLITELDPDCPDIAYGLCDLGMGIPELGSVSLEELRSIRGPAGLGIERDRSFKATKRLSEYAEEANTLGRINA